MAFSFNQNQEPWDSGNTGDYTNIYNGGLSDSINNGYNYDGQGSNPVGNFLGDVGQWFFGGNGSNMLGALPLAGMAGQQYRNAGQYRQMGENAAKMADPFGSQRGMYQGMLSKIYNDPASVLADPQHQAIMNSQLDAIQGRNRAAGYMGSGKDTTDMINYAAQENAKYLNDEKARLAMLSGAQFDPANAAQMYMMGGQQALGAENAGLGALGMMYQNGMGYPSGLQGRPGMYQQGGPNLMQSGANAWRYLTGGGSGGGGGMNFPGSGSFTPNLSSPYWNQYTGDNYDTSGLGNQYNQTHYGNSGVGSMYDEWGGLNPMYGANNSWDSGNNSFFDPSQLQQDPFAWFSDYQDWGGW